MTCKIREVASHSDERVPSAIRIRWLDMHATPAAFPLFEAVPSVFGLWSWTGTDQSIFLKAGRIAVAKPCCASCVAEVSEAVITSSPCVTCSSLYTCALEYILVGLVMANLKVSGLEGPGLDASPNLCNWR